MTGGGGIGSGGGFYNSRRFAPADKDGWHRRKSNQERRFQGRRGSGPVDVATCDRKPGGGEVSSFYFTSFPESWKARDLLSIFDKQGRVQEVVIPGRRNVQGRRFGFVRFFDVREPDRLATILDNVFIEGEKIQVNLPRFQREVKRSRSQQVNHGGHQQKNHKQVWVKKSDLPKREKVMGRNSGGAWSCNMETDPLLSSAMVGEVITPGKAYYIQDELAQMGVFAIKATPMGANLVLLEGDKEEGDFAEYIEDAREWLYQWFKWIRPWKPSDIDPERTTWLRCYGVPVHAWNLAFFSKLASQVGEFVCVDDNTERKRSLDVARILARTQVPETINRVTEVVINNISFPIKLVEDWGGAILRRSQEYNNGDEDGIDSSSDGESDHMFSGADDIQDEEEVEELELNAFLTVVRNTGKIDPSIMASGSNKSLPNNHEVASISNEGDIQFAKESPITSEGSYVEETNPSLLLKAQHSGTETPSGDVHSIDLPSIQNRPKSKAGCARSHKQRKLLMVGEKRKKRAGKLPLAPRELKEVSVGSIQGSQAPENSHVVSRNQSSLFSAGTVLCGGSISSGDIAACNNKFWALQSKAVARKVWENAKLLGVQGNLPDDRYVDLIEDGERRDEAESSKRANSTRPS